ncbi:MAG: YXWGXW repeat-containing protein [Deltaproteobacteria bacterium]|nr:YXWGXW repeat-containing protein [Deltaproteobacteria bacterium]
MIRRFFARFVAVLLSLVLLVPQTADAGPRRSDPRSRPRVHVDVRAHHPGGGWTWVAPRPGRFGAWIAGHYVHVGIPPHPGWVWVPGWWNGVLWITGFWRPAGIVGYHWVEGGPGPDGVWVPGYWAPDAPSPEGMVWRPGYWTGSAWVSGRWVPVESYNVIGPDGQLEFFGVGDGHVDEVALPAVEDVYNEEGNVEDGPGALEPPPEEAPPAEVHAPAP